MVSVTALNLIAQAAGNIGATGQAIETGVSNFEATSTTGGVFVTNTGDLNIGGADAGMTGVQAQGDITIEAQSNLNVIESMQSVAGNIKLTASTDLTISGAFVVARKPA